jgi:hypothetical protein
MLENSKLLMNSLIITMGLAGFSYLARKFKLQDLI